MNTKKITALVLAAMMAAGTTTAAFAEATNKDQALIFADPANAATVYEENDDGLLVVTDNTINPGDSLYFLLKDGAADSSGVTDKERDRINVYADWKLGKEYIDSIDVIYKKGNSKVTGYTYTVSGTGYFATAKTFDIAGSKRTTAANVGKALPADVLAAALESEYTKVEGYKNSSDNKYYSDDVEGLKALLTSLNWRAGAEGEMVTAMPDTNKNGFGTITTPGSGSVELNENIWIDNATLGSATMFIDITKVTSITDLIAIQNDSAADSGADISSSLTNIATVGDDAYVAGDAPTNGSVVSIVGKTAAEGVIKGTVSTIDKTVEIRDSSSYTYWVEVKTKDDITTKELDLAGTLYLGTTKNSAEKYGTRLPVDMSLTNRLYDSSNNFLSVEDEVTINPDENGAVKFEPDAEEVTIYFGENEDAWFTFNAQGQGALNLAYTTEFNKEIADLFPEANIDFITWTAAPATNRTGDLYITADEDTYLYEVTDKGVQTVAYLPAAGNGVVSAALGVKDIAGAEFDEDEGAWHIRTRKLGSYAISDMELDTSITVDGDEVSSGSSTDNGDKPNPDTGR